MLRLLQIEGKLPYAYENIQEFLQTQEMFMQKALLELIVKNMKEFIPAAQNHTCMSDISILIRLTLMFSNEREFFECWKIQS